jgi:hypothetical protein
MTWNPFHKRGETPRDRAEQTDRLERQVRKGLATRAPEPGSTTSTESSPTLTPSDRAAFVRRIKAVLAA